MPTNMTTLKELVRAHLLVESYFFRHAIGITAAAIPFALISVGTPGVVAAVVWGLLLLSITFPGFIIFFLAMGDAFRMAFGRTPLWYPMLPRLARTDLTSIKAQMTWLQRLWFELSLRLGFYMNPVTIPTMFLASWIRESDTGRPDGHHPGPAAKAYAAKVQRRERQIEDIESGAMAGVA